MDESAHGRYVRTLQPLLPPEAFARNPRRLIAGAAHALLFLAIGLALPHLDLLVLRLLASAVAGHSLMCLALFAHEVSHGTVIRPGPARYLCELASWGPNLIAPTLWRVVHNQTHHRHANTIADPDRRFVTSEDTPATRLYTRLFYPYGGKPRTNPLILVHFIPYILKQTLGALLPAGRRALLIPAPVAFTARDRLAIAAEVVVIAGLQYALYRWTGARWSSYLFIGPLAVIGASAFVMGYVFTNHFANPLLPRADPIVGTTSVVVPAFVDRLHNNFSFHTEHHLFPALDSRFLPQLGRLLQEHFPAEYRRLPLAQAWRLAWRERAFVEIAADHWSGTRSRPSSGRPSITG